MRLTVLKSARFLLLALLATLHGVPALAGVLAEDRADVLYHRYSGDDVTIQGPSVLVRKKLGNRLPWIPLSHPREARHAA